MLGRLRAEGLKLTAQRRAIVQQFATDESHPTAQELFERLRGAFPKMSFATVYNTLDALTHAGLSSTLRSALLRAPQKAAVRRTPRVSIRTSSRIIMRCAIAAGRCRTFPQSRSRQPRPPLDR